MTDAAGAMPPTSEDPATGLLAERLIHWKHSHKLQFQDCFAYIVGTVQSFQASPDQKCTPWFKLRSISPLALMALFLTASTLENSAPSSSKILLPSLT